MAAWDGGAAVEARWFSDLRGRAMARMRAAAPQVDPILDELKVHRIELEMQNEELRRSQRELEESRDRYRSLLAAAPLGYIAIDDKGRIRDVSPPAADLLGHPLAKLLGRHVQGLLRPADADMLHVNLRACLSTGTARAFDVGIEAKVGAARILRLQMVKALESPAGAKQECWAFMTDLTMARPSAEREVAEAEPEPEAVVLLVDDEIMVRKTMGKILESEGYRVIAVGSGAEAIAVASREGQRLDVLVTDVCMPGMHGAELGERLAILRPDLPRIYMSGYLGGITLEEGALLLEKPFHPNRLLEIVAKRLSEA